MKLVTGRKGEAAAVLSAVFWIATCWGETPPPAGPRLAASLEAVVAGLSETVYQHRTEIDAEAGEFRCDCSGLIGFFLKRDFPTAYSSLDGVEAPWRKRPLAVTFYETFVRAGEGKVPGWTAVENLLEAKPGDFIAWRGDKLEQGSSTGHVLMVAGLPVAERDGRVRLRVIDSTSRIHAEDTRPDGTNGVGAGTMWFEVDENGRPLRYYVDSDPEPGKSTRIAIGRLTNF